ncbi:hypothetical protein [Xylocopilactobacillus apicola]|nr:hypothetical protein [Xylocopilactobacillus apicola]
MNFEKRELSLNKVISFNLELDPLEDIFEQADEAGQEFKELLIQNGFYSDSPIIFRSKSFELGGDVSIMTTVGNKLNIVGENKSSFDFFDQIEFTTDYYYRHYDQLEPIPYDDIMEKIREGHKKLKNIYFILLDLYGDQVVDMYCEVED